jgi:hypothetical protein
VTLLEKLEQRISENLVSIHQERRMIQAHRAALCFLRSNTLKLHDICTHTKNQDTALVQIVRFNETYIYCDMLTSNHDVQGRSAISTVWYTDLVNGISVLKLVKKEDLALYVGMKWVAPKFESLCRKSPV